MTFKGKLQVLTAYGLTVKIRYGKLMSVKMVPFDGFKVQVLDQTMFGWIGESEDLAKAVDIVYKKFKDNPPQVKFV